MTQLCAYGFVAATPDQSVSFRVSFGRDDPAPGAYDLADVDLAEVQFGAELTANSCDDVLEQGEPEPRVDERRQIVGGAITLTIEGDQATVELTDIVAGTTDGRDDPLGDTTIMANGWGRFPG